MLVILQNVLELTNYTLYHEFCLFKKVTEFVNVQRKAIQC